MDNKTSQSWKNARLARNLNLGQVCLSWLQTDSKLSIESIKSVIFITLVDRTLPEAQKIVKNGPRGRPVLFEY